MTQPRAAADEQQPYHPPKLGRDYWRLWWANAVSSTGDGAFVAALPLLAVTITRDPRLVSVVTAATYLPWMVLSLPAGALVDRHDRATLMWRVQAVQAAVVTAVAVLVVVRAANVELLLNSRTDYILEDNPGLTREDAYNKLKQNLIENRDCADNFGMFPAEKTDATEAAVNAETAEPARGIPLPSNEVS